MYRMKRLSIILILFLLIGNSLEAYISETRFIDNGDGTVTDIGTGLMWQKDNAGRFTWIAALDYAENLTLAGYSDWRLPNIEELTTFFDYWKYDSAVNAAMDFVIVEGDASFWLLHYECYWSSSTRQDWSNNAWCANIIRRNISIRDKTAWHPVRLVRSDDYGPHGSLTVSIEPEGAVENGAKWRRTGTSTWYDSNSREPYVPAGTHTVEFKYVTALIKPAWIQPENITVTIDANQRTSAAAAYTPLDVCLTSCISVDDDTLRLTAPCGNYQGARYAFNADYMDKLSWGLDLETLSETEFGKCQYFDEHLNMTVTCAEFQGNKYTFRLNHGGNFIWDMVPESFQPIHTRYCLDVVSMLPPFGFGSSAFPVRLVNLDTCEAVADFKIRSHDACVYSGGENGEERYLIACYYDVRVAEQFNALVRFKAMINEVEYEYPGDSCRGKF